MAPYSRFCYRQLAAGAVIAVVTLIVKWLYRAIAALF
jgi:hypothetical protein